MSSQLFDFSGQAALVSVSISRLGRSIAVGLAEAVADLMPPVRRDVAGLDKTAGEIEELARVGLKVLAGYEHHIVEASQTGAAGIVPVSANHEPATFLRASEAGCAGDALELERC